MLHTRMRWVLMVVPCVGCFPGDGCSTNDVAEPRNADLTAVDTAVIHINEHTFKVWVADTEAERLRGLMNVTAEEMAPLPDGTERGMWFIFPEDQPAWHGFWMRDTIIALDIAYVRADGRIVTIRTMAPRDERPYNSKAPYRYALEVNANVFSRLGIREGHRVEIPKSLLKTSR